MPTTDPAATLKQKAHALIDQLPETVNWDDLAYEMELRASIERGLADSNQAGFTSTLTGRRGPGS